MIRPAAPDLTRRSGALRWPFTLAFAVALAGTGGFAWDRWRDSGSATLDPAALRPWFGPPSFAEAVAQAKRDVDGAREALAIAPDEWVLGEELALKLIARWRLLGDYGDLAEADRLLAAGMAGAPDPAGPVLAEATFAVLVHRLDRAEAALARFARSVVQDSDEAADAAALAGDIALQRGKIAAARGKYAQAVRIAPPATGDVRLALFPALRGEPDRAIAELERIIAAPRQSPWTLASLMLRRANLDLQRGDWTGAGRWVGAAQRAFPGWWLADAYAAQQFALAGRTDEANRAYTIVAERSDRPEVMDSLAHLLRLQGQGAESRAWAGRAAARWAEIGAQFPEAVAHHRSEHELAAGSAARALVFAQEDAARRPQAPNLVLLARALLAAGRAREAIAQLDRADAQGWVSANHLLARADVLAALGEAESSDAAREAAKALNPRAGDPRARLIWFGHD
ncbi:MAG: hypothetical protein Q8R44_06910 [Novosphingobium sp.]|nr:hypothetical protein [Novosphingobium sp.]